MFLILGQFAVSGYSRLYIVEASALHMKWCSKMNVLSRSTDCSVDVKNSKLYFALKSGYIQVKTTVKLCYALFLFVQLLIL